MTIRYQEMAFLDNGLMHFKFVGMFLRINPKFIILKIFEGT